MKSLLKRLLSICVSVPLSILKSEQFKSISGVELENANFYFSQFGEDILVYNLLRTTRNQKGIYVDVGAFDPMLFSNTHLLYKRGWRGINIDLEDDKIKKFNRYRPDDINLVRAVSNKKMSMKCLRYHHPATTRIVPVDESDEVSLIGELPIEVKRLETVTLSEILDEHLDRGQAIDYLNVDCEGHEIEVLEGLDFDRYAPKLISVEAQSPEQRSNMDQFLGEKGYRMCALSTMTAIYQKT